MSDFDKLANSEKNVPNMETKLMACTTCALILTSKQWSDMNNSNYCPNCGEYTNQTSDFEGIVAIMCPSTSWVARWNKKSTCIPGIYALKVNDYELND